MFKKRGFTLIELIAVTAIVSFLAYLSVPFGEALYQKASVDKTLDALETMRNALDQYYRDHGHYPLIPTFTSTTPEDQRFSALQVMERELAGKEFPNFPDLSPIKSQRVYLVEIPKNPYTGRVEDWEVRDSYLPAWHPINEAMNPAPDNYGAAGIGETGTYTGDINATGTYFNSNNVEKTRDIFDVRFPKWLHKKVRIGNVDKDLSEF